MPLYAPSTSPLDLLASGELLIVPSDLAAQRLRHSFDRQQQQAGTRVWQPAPVLSWGQWMQSLWSECVVSGHEDRLLLNAHQEHLLWREIVATTSESQPHETLASNSSLAELAAPAWRLAAAYSAARQLRSSATTHDARTFAAWAEQFTRACQRNAYLSRAQLESAINAHIARQAVALPAKVNLSGFLDWTPSQRDLLEAAREAGTQIDLIDAARATDHPNSLLSAASEEEELCAVAAWVRRFLQNQPDANVGILVPDLDSKRYALDTAFREVLAPELEFVGEDASSKPYEFASGTPLASQPMIAAGLDLARWVAGPLPLETISALLLSPYLSSPGQRAGAAQFDACALRQTKLLRPESSLAWLVRLADRSQFGAAPRAWLQPLQSFLASVNLQTPRAFAEWSEIIRRMLRSTGWPGNPANGLEVELAQAWDHALDTIATLDFTGTRVLYSEALQALERIASSTSFPLTTGEAPVQIMRPADLPGMAFDALVFLGATDSNWPPQERTHPLIDWKLQASLGMPGADSARAAQRADSAMQAILSSAKDVLFSYATNNSEGKQRLSPAVARLDLKAIDADLFSGNERPESVAPEYVPDDAPLPPLPSPHIHGGASVLQHQAACGFRAFAEIRLRALSLEERQAGFDARELGNLLHRTLQLFWGAVETQAALRNMSLDERKAGLADCIETAFGHHLRAESEWDRAYIALQKQRLSGLLLRWLDHELQRGPFEVLSAESTETLTVGPLSFNVRVDRLDRLPHLAKDAVFLVDYKTGYSAKPADWLGERPDEPQLPLYALLPQAEHLAGLAFAKVRAGDSMEWLGFAADTGILPGKSAVRDLAAQTGEWRANLTTIAKDFAAGDAAVRPKEYPVTCAHCGQRMLCRLDAATLLAVSESDESGQENPSFG